MNIGKLISIRKICSTQDIDQSTHKERQKISLLTQNNSSQFQPFKMLFKYIHPESSFSSTAKIVAENEKDKQASEKAINFNKQPPQLQEMISITSIQSVCITKMGIRNYDNMENQDVLLQDQISNKCKIYGIFDGHGEYGRVIAQTTKNIFQNLLQKYSEDIKNENSLLSIQNIIKKVFQKTNLYILHYKAEQAQFSGTTALIVLITTTKIYSFNVGNSRLVLGKYYQKTNKIQSFQVTHDHTISRFDQRLRIIKSGGIIGPFKNERGQKLGPDRIWAKNESYPGIYVTRTLGLSCAHKIGVISEPQVNVIQYKKCYKFLLLGSDGLWTVQQNDQAVKIFQKQYKTSLSFLANSLISEAIKRWRAKNQLMDDITLIVISL